MSHSLRRNDIMYHTESAVINNLMDAIPHAKKITISNNGHGRVSINLDLPLWRRFLIIPAMADRRVAHALLPFMISAGIVWALS